MKTINELVDAFDEAAKLHGWAEDSGTREQATEAQKTYAQAKAELMWRVSWFQSQLGVARAELERKDSVIAGRDQEVERLALALTHMVKLKNPDTAPKDTTVFLGDFGSPGLQQTVWSPYEGQWLTSKMHLNMVNGVYSDPYFEAEYLDFNELRGWASLSQFGQWRSMDSAPVDGRKVILSWGGNSLCARYVRDKEKPTIFCGDVLGGSSFAHRMMNGAGWQVESPATEPPGQPDGWMPYPLARGSAIEKIASEVDVTTSPWIRVAERLPDPGVMVFVYSPPQPQDWPESVRIEFDAIDPESDGRSWVNHSAHYEHFCCVAKGDMDVPMTGPSEKAPYTYWMAIPDVPGMPSFQKKPGEGNAED